MSTVIVLNGVGSVGKTSVARALQSLLASPLLHVEMDAFLAMMPPRLLNHPDGLLFEKTTMDGEVAVAIRCGGLLDQVTRGMRRAIAALADAGNDLVVDDVMLGQGEAADYREVLAGHRLLFVGLFAPLAVLEERERARGDREIGLARWQFERVHLGVDYDLRIDTALSSPEESAQAIRRRLDLLGGSDLMATGQPRPTISASMPRAMSHCRAMATAPLPEMHHALFSNEAFSVTVTRSPISGT